MPQGSILGPLLFICYINDVQLHCRTSKCYRYADDTAIIMSDPDPDVVKLNLQEDLNRLQTWFQVNKLSINCKKTNTILFCSQRSRHKNYDLNLELHGMRLNQTNEIKYLGLILDRHLTFEQHVAAICNKVNIRTKLLWRVQNFIPRSLARTLYVA